MEKTLQELIDNNKILVLSKQNCKYCDIAKDALTEAGLDYIAKEIDSTSKLYTEAIALTNQRTVPNIWIDGKHIGGSDKLLVWLRHG